MGTTLLFAELLIIGAEVGLWFFILIYAILGEHLLGFLQTAHDFEWQTLITVILLGIFYVLGIMFDRLADNLFHGWSRILRNKIIPNAKLPLGVMRFELGRDNTSLDRQLEYTRSRIRITRASSLNFVITTILFETLLLTRIQDINTGEVWIYSISILLLGALLSSLAVFSWRRLTIGYLDLVRINYELYETKQKKAIGNAQKSVDEQEQE